MTDSQKDLFTFFPTTSKNEALNKTCTSCDRLISEHILCSYDKVSLYCPGGPGSSKEQELKTIKELLAVFQKLGI